MEPSTAVGPYILLHGEEVEKPSYPGFAWTLKVILSSAIFFASVSLVPIFSKHLFSGQGTVPKFPYPVATAFLQLAFTALCLTTLSVLRHIVRKALGYGLPGDSFILGRHFCYKLRYAGPVGVFFGLKFAVTNWGLQLVPLSTHVLLQATDLLFTAALARCMNKEKLGRVEGRAVLILSVGSVMVSFDASTSLSAPFVPLLVNILTPLVLALTVTSLRSGVQELLRDDNRLNGSMTVLEFTALKTMVASAASFVVSLAIEGGFAQLSKHTGLRESKKLAWWDALAEYPMEGCMILLWGSLSVLIFQMNITWLTKLTSATTVGVVGTMKVIPQWLLNSVCGLSTAKSSPLHTAGALTVLLACGLYASESACGRHFAPTPWEPEVCLRCWFGFGCDNKHRCPRSAASGQDRLQDTACLPC
mmetsp:Transcript_32178/g.70428  ORF Transcript_32178/g.70428 Transcript_32178/m.70428 type:complete len:418 (-) Transcript_32178:435-1688(-)